MKKAHLIFSQLLAIGILIHPKRVFLQTKNGTQLKELQPGDKPYAHFMIFDDDEIISVFEFCNLHGLWKADKIS